MYRVPTPGDDSPRAVGVLRCSSFRDGDEHVIALVGELDLATIYEVERALEHVQADDPELIVLDLSELAFMDSTGLEFLIAAHRRVDRLVIVKGPRAVQRVVEICGFGERLPFIDARPVTRPALSLAPPPPAPPAEPVRDDPAAVGDRAAVVRRAKQAAMSNAVRQLRSRRRGGLRPVP